MSPARSASVLLASPYRGTGLEAPARERAAHDLDKSLQVHTVNAAKVARKAGLGGRINTVMQACFFALADVMPTDEALELIKDSARKAYAKRGPEIVQANLDAIDKALAAMTEVVIPDDAGDHSARRGSPRSVTAPRSHPNWQRSAGWCREGELLPVSAMSPGGTFPTGTAALEKPGLATQLPVWESDNCIDCGSTLNRRTQRSA